MRPTFSHLALLLTACAAPTAPSTPPVSATEETPDAAPPAPTPASTPQPEFDRASIDAKIRARVVDLRACYDARVKVDSTLEGVVLVEFVIDGQGHLGQEVFESETLNDTELNACLAGVLRSIEFPVSEDGGEIEVRYPLDFRSRP